jgi:hypothetical protein
MSNKDTIIDALAMQLRLEREGNLALAKRAKREWVGLADVEVAGLTCECVDDGTFNMSCAHDFARAIEKALKEKNNG